MPRSSPFSLFSQKSAYIRCATQIDLYSTADLPDHPVLFAVDEFNTWEVPSAFHYRMKAVTGKELCVPNALNFLGVKKTEGEGMRSIAVVMSYRASSRPSFKPGFGCHLLQ